MTGFRIAKGCAQEYFGVTPDLTTLGKVIGGGLPVGAYGGRADIMKMVAPAGPMYQVYNVTLHCTYVHHIADLNSMLHAFLLLLQLASEHLVTLHNLLSEGSKLS